MDEQIQLRKKEKWKPAHFYHILVLLFLNLNPVYCKKWDRVIVIKSDYQALKAVKHELVDFRGVLNTWNETRAGPCSSWAGIRCAKGQVIAIELPWKVLGGRISEKIGKLKALRRLSLHDNVLMGPVPMSIGLLSNLRGVYLFNNRLSGSIPPSIGNCLYLHTLDLSNNQLSGSIPSSLANLNKMYRLNLSRNGISGPLPMRLARIPSLTFLDLHHNNFSGFIERLDMSHNFIVENIPDELGNLSSLNFLDLSDNAISGNIPESFSKLSSLVTLNLKNNNLDGPIPGFIEKIVNLAVINLSNNKFGGKIPETIGNITSLASLDLSDNNLTGEIPISIAHLPNLSFFDVSHNNLSGPVPSVLAEKFNSSSFLGNIQLCGYSRSTPCPSPNQGVENPHRKKLSTKDIIIIASGAILFVILTLCCAPLCCLMRKKSISKAKKGKSGNAKSVLAVGPVAGEMEGKLVHFDGPFVFTADDLLCATAEIMGKSTYGTAYKATLEDGNRVGVKRLREKITKERVEFEVEIGRLGKIRHPNILALRAYYLGPKGEKLLVYDYMPNGSLASFLHARGPETAIPWPTRIAIVVGTARGLRHLHDDQNTVHGNLSSSNILLDEQTNPKIADVGLSRLMATSTANSDVVPTAGAMGYRAPELSKPKNATAKSDVFSLGVVILELLTGKSPGEAYDGLDLPQWVASIVKEEWTNEVFDVELLRDNSEDIGDELLNALKLALHCVDPSPGARPEAKQVLEKLEEIRPGPTGVGDVAERSE